MGEPACAGTGSMQAAQETSLSDSSRSSDQAMARSSYQGVLSVLLKYVSSREPAASS